MKLAAAPTPVLRVVGGAPEITSAVTNARIVRTPAANADALVFDLRTTSVAELSEVRATMRTLPLLLLSSREIPEAIFQILHADDELLVGSSSEGCMRRRLAMLLELARRPRLLDEQQRFERLAALGTMVAGFAHEVRNPVAALRSIAEELSEELRDAGVTMPHVGLMLQMVERIERLVRTSLQFGRPAAPRLAPQRPWVIASSALSEIRARLRGTGQDIAIEAEADLPDVNVDERQLAQALVILLNNALDATGSASRVSLRLKRLPAGVCFEVFDDGPGIAPNIVERIFDPFFTTKTTGTGLGLSIAQQIVSENRGRLQVTSTVGSTAFTVTLPAEVCAYPAHEAAR